MSLLLILNLPLIAEVVRKYLVHSNVVFLCADIISLITMVYHMIKVKRIPRAPNSTILCVVFFLVCVFATAIRESRSFLFFLVGIRSCFFPLVYMSLSALFLAYHQDDWSKVYNAATFWVFTCCVVGIVQIALGPDHPINAVWGKVGVGQGDYVVLEKSAIVPGLFRPTSIFMHTGKFGQTIFVLVLFRWCYIALSENSVRVMTILTMSCDVFTIFLSGQRAAILFLILSALCILVLTSTVSLGRAVKLLLGLFCVSAILTGLAWLEPKYGRAAVSTGLSLMQSLPIRIQSAWFSLKVLIDKFPLTGVGFGYFTLGSGYFGGVPSYIELKSCGVGEGTPGRIIGEAGFVGSLFLFSALAALFAKAFENFRAMISSADRASGLFFMLWCMSMLFWSLTHDVFANTISTFQAAAFSGAAFSYQSPVREKDLNP